MRFKFQEGRRPHKVQDSEESMFIRDDGWWGWWVGLRGSAWWGWWEGVRGSSWSPLGCLLPQLLFILSKITRESCQNCRGTCRPTWGVCDIKERLELYRSWNSSELRVVWRIMSSERRSPGKSSQPWSKVIKLLWKHLIVTSTLICNKNLCLLWWNI